MEYVKPLDPYTLEEVDGPYRDRQAGVKGHAIQAAAVEHGMKEILHVIDFYLGDGSEASGQNGADLEQLRKAIEQAISNAVSGGGGGGSSFTPRTDEEIQDVVAAFLQSQDILITYDDAGNVLSIQTPFADSVTTIAGSSQTKAVTPAGLKTLTANTTRNGLAKRATDEMALEKVDNERFVTSYHLGLIAQHNFRPVAEILVKGKGTSSSNQSEAPSATIIHNLGVAGLVATAVNEGGNGGTTRLDLTWDNAGEVVNSNPFGVAEGEDFSSLTAMTYTDGRGNIIRAQNIDDPGTPEMKLGTSFTAILYARA